MKFRTIIKVMLLGAVTNVLFACGGGGGTTSSTPSNTVVSGVAAKGVFKSGIVRVYAVNADGTQGALLKETPILDDKGNYNADLGRIYSGALIIKAFGTYRDEATQLDVTTDATTALTAAIPASVVAAASAAGSTSISVPVTALTEIAFQKAVAAGGNLNSTIDDANKSISTLFGVDIIKTQPVKYDTATLSSNLTSAEQQKYTAILATVSQLIATNSTHAADTAPSAGDMKNTLAGLSSSITVSGSGSTATAQITSVQMTAALTTAQQTIASSPAAPPAIATIIAQLPKLPTVAVYKLKTVGSVTGNVINGIQFTLGLPVTMTLESNATTGVTAAGVVSTSGLAAGATLESKFTSATTSSSGLLNIAIADSYSFGIGEFATIYFKVAAGGTAPEVSALTPITKLKVVDSKGSVISGVTVVVFQ